MQQKLFFLLIAATLVASGCKKSKFGSEWFTMDFDGEKRGYLVHVPDIHDGTTPTSLIIALHGGVGTPKNIEEQSGLSTLSDAEGFIACYPKGLNRTWNADGCCGKAQEKNHDDVGFISALIDELLADYAIDPNRVYVTGMSNGAFMTYRLACEIPEKIAAIAPVAGTMSVTTCNPDRPVPVIHFHSYLDQNIPWQGGVGGGISDHWNPALDSVLTVWAAINGCVTADTLLEESPDFDHRAWLNCTDTATVDLYISNDGRHSWPMGTNPIGPKPYRSLDDPSQTLNANALMWAFFEAHPRR